MSICFKITCFVAYKQTIARGETYHYVLFVTWRGEYSVTGQRLHLKMIVPLIDLWAQNSP